MARTFSVTKVLDPEVYIYFQLTDDQWPDQDVKLNAEFDEIPINQEEFDNLVVSLKKAMNDEMDRRIQISDKYIEAAKLDKLNQVINTNVQGQIKPAIVQAIKARLY